MNSVFHPTVRSQMNCLRCVFNKTLNIAYFMRVLDIAVHSVFFKYFLHSSQFEGVQFLNDEVMEHFESFSNS